MISAGGREFVLRIAPPDSMLQLFYEKRMMRQEPGIHARLRMETSVPVPEITAFDFSRGKIERDYLIMPLCPGEPLSEASLSAAGRRRALREWGELVRQVHDVNARDNLFGYLGEHNCMAPQNTWQDAFRVMYGKLLDDIVGCGVYDRDTASSAMKLLDDHNEVFEACEDSRLCHGDLWVTNLLVGPGGAVTCLLDWDRACWGDIEWDLAIAEYCGVTRPPFWEGYGRRVETHRGQASVRRFFYLLYEHQKYIVISMSTRRNSPEGARRYARESLAAMSRFRKSGKPEF
jgi:aminoglycoside phosphotransferase (APT) family kinase protein